MFSFFFVLNFSEIFIFHSQNIDDGIESHSGNSSKKKRRNFQEIFNDEQIYIHSNYDNSSGDKNSTESTSNQNTKKETSNDSGKNQKIEPNQKTNNLYPQQILNKSQFYLPNHDQNQRLSSNPTSSNDSSNSNQTIDYNRNDMKKNTSNTSFINNNKFVNCFPQNFQHNNPQPLQISYIPYNLLPYGQYPHTIVGYPTLAYIPIAQTPNYFNNQMMNSNVPAFYTSYNNINRNAGVVFFNEKDVF